jgi:hypothetical protein
MITRQNLIENGYKRCDTGTNPYSNALYQKRIDDKVGKKYFIDIDEYVFPNKISYSPSVSYFKHFKADDDNNYDTFIDVTFHTVDLTELENLAEKYWKFSGKSYYEFWEEI